MLNQTLYSTQAQTPTTPQKENQSSTSSFSTLPSPVTSAQSTPHSQISSSVPSSTSSPTQPSKISPIQNTTPSFPQIFSQSPNSSASTSTTSSDPTSIKDTRINIRLSSSQLEALKARATQEGLPYQTLISSLIHRYLTGQLVNIGPCAQCHQAHINE